MGKFTERLKSLFRRRRPVTAEEAEVLSTWVSEGGTYDPDGPPPVADDHDRDSKGEAER